MYHYQKYEQFWHKPSSDYYRLLHPWLEKYLSAFKQENIVEIGFGSGHLALILARLGFEGQYHGIDIDENAITFSKNNLKNFSNANHFNFEIFDHKSSQKEFDLAIFCLSICEMDDAQVSWYLKNIKAKKLLIINPSTLTFYYPAQITKTWLSKLTSRLGQTPKWILKTQIPEANQDLSHRLLGNDPDLKVRMKYRSLGEMLNLATQNNWNFTQYTDLKYNISDIKTAPVSKFEILEFDKVDKM
jgi:SAM-dependent methyltransferase